MPDQTSNLTALRANHRAPYHVTPMIGDLLLIGTVGSATTKAITYAVDSGSATNVKPGMRIVVTDSSGDYKGTLSVRYSGTINSTNMPIRETSSGTVQIAAGDKIRVYRGFVLTDKLVEADEAFAPDGIAVSSENTTPRPRVCSGGWYVNWLPASGSLLIPLYGSDSGTVDIDSSGAITHLWTTTGGTLSGSSAADPTLTVTAAGYYLVTHTVTDDTNGMSETQYVPIRVHDSADMPYECILSSVDGDGQTGFRAAFELFENATLSSLPDDTPMIIWDDAQTFGHKVDGRSHILMIGYLRRDRARGDANSDSVEFEAISPLARLAELPGFSKAMVNEASPDAWDEVKDLSVSRGIIQLLRYYSNVLHLFDLNFIGYVDRDYPAFYLQKGNPYDQVRELADAVDCRFVCDRVGRLEVQRRLEFTPLDERGTPATTLTMNADDIIDYEMSREHWLPIETVRVRGFTKGYTDNQTVFARFPATPGRGNASPVFDKLIADSAADLYERCALRGAFENKVFFDADGLQHAAPELRLTLFGGYARLFQFYREWVAFSGITTLRGVNLSAFRWMLVSVSESYEGGTATCSLTLQAETHAPASAAVDDTPTSGSTSNTEPPIIYPPPVTTTPPTRIAGWTGEAPIKMFALSYAESKAAKATNFDPNTGSVTWVDISSGLSGTGIWARSDPYNYFRRFALTTNGLYRCNDIWATSPVWTQVATNAQMFGNSARRGYKLLMSHLRQGWIMALSGDSGAGISFDYGVTWTQVSIDGGTAAWGTSVTRGGDVEICGHDANHLYSIVQAGSVWLHNVYKSIDGGLTWSATGGAASNGGGLTSIMNMHIPYKKAGGANNADDGSLHIYTSSKSGGAQAVLQKSTNGGSSFSDLYYGSGAVQPGHAFIGNGLTAFTHDANYWWFANREDVSNYFKVWRTTDDFSATASKYSPTLAFPYGMVNGWSQDPGCAIIFHAQYRIAWTLDGGATFWATIPGGWADGVAYAEFDLSDFITARG